MVVYIENRRDPFDLIGLYVDDVGSAVEYHEKAFGMKADRSYGDKQVGRFEPARIPGSVLMSYGDRNDTTALLLVPKSALQGGQSEAIKPSTIKIAVLDRDVYARKERLEAVGVAPKYVGEVPGTGGPKVALVSPKQGAPIVFVDYGDFEREQPPPKVLTIKEEVQAYVAMAKDDEN